MKIILTIAGAAILATLFALPASAADADKGAKVFRKCKACHTLDEGGKNRVGPNLFGVIGRTSGTVEGFKYSSAMKEAAIVWDDETLDAYLTKPKAVVPKGKMAFGGIKKEGQRADLIEYLKQETQ